jgi:hypothetical protein
MTRRRFMIHAQRQLQPNWSSMQVRRMRYDTIRWASYIEHNRVFSTRLLLCIVIWYWACWNLVMDKSILVFCKFLLVCLNFSFLLDDICCRCALQVVYLSCCECILSLLIMQHIGFWDLLDGFSLFIDSSVSCLLSSVLQFFLSFLIAT